MDSASFEFVLFGLTASIVSNLSCSRAWRQVVLLSASIVLLCILAGNPIALLPLIGFLLLGYGALSLLEHGGSWHSVWYILTIIFAYIWLKKYTFLPEISFLRFPFLTLGLSYMFFRVLHLLIESGQGGKKQHITLGAYLVYTVNFTTLISGPIQRYDEFARDQFADEPIALGPRVIGLQLERIVRGLFKVNVLGILLNAVRQDAFAQMSQPIPGFVKMFSAFQLAIVYPFFLYANFSGYIDIVIAIARLMRIRLPENFDRPFSASSFSDFWNRWHITLSTWLKTYVYNPLLLALMRQISSPRTQPFLGVFSFFVTFFLVGIWHGRTSEFMMFGVLQGAGVAFNKLWQIWMTTRFGRKTYRELTARDIYVAFGRGLTFSWFAFTLFWFWASWRQIDMIMKSIGAVQWLCVWLAIFLFATVAFALWERVRSLLLSIRTLEGPVFTSRYARVVYASALGLAAFVVTILLNQPAPGIVYKGF